MHRVKYVQSSAEAVGKLISIQTQRHRGQHDEKRDNGFKMRVQYYGVAPKPHWMQRGEYHHRFSNQRITHTLQGGDTNVILMGRLHLVSTQDAKDSVGVKQAVIIPAKVDSVLKRKEQGHASAK